MENNTTTKTREVLLHDVDKLKRSAVQVAQDVRKHAAAQVDETKLRVTGAIETARETLITHPLSFLGIGFGMGLLLGLRIRR